MAFQDAVFDIVSSVAEQVHPMAVQLDWELSASPPLCMKECLQIKSRLAFEHVVDRPGQFMRQEGQGFPLAVLFFQFGQQFLTGRIIS